MKKKLIVLSVILLLTMGCVKAKSTNNEMAFLDGVSCGLDVCECFNTGNDSDTCTKQLNDCMKQYTDQQIPLKTKRTEM